MNEAIHSCLDGEAPLEVLSSQEQAQLQEMQAVIGAVADHLRTYPAPDLVSNVMRALPAAEPAIAPAAGAAVASPGIWERVRSWLLTPQPVRLTIRPAYALAGALVLVLSLALTSLLFEPQSVRMAGAPAAAPAAGAEQRAEEAAPPRIYVQFRLEVPSAEHVALAGSFTGWQPAYVLEETESGVWTALVPLQPGVHDYAFVVDGERWVVDPHAFQVPDSFGGKNSRLSLPVPSEST